MLTAKQEIFCQQVALSNTYADAYRHAYDTDKMKPAVIRQRAYELADQPKIKQRIGEILDKRLNDSLLNDRKRMREFVFDRLMIEATDLGNPPAARIRALEDIAKIDTIDMFNNKVEHEHRKELTSEEIRKQIESKLENILDKAKVISPD